jgi:chromate transporter
MKTSSGAAVSKTHIAMTFLVIAMISFGGGLSAHAFRVLTEEKKWLAKEEFLSFLALSRILPGANMVNLAICVGSRFGGAWGAVAATSGLLGLPLLLILSIGLLYFHFQTVPGVAAVLSGLAAVAVGLTLSMGFKTLEDYFKSPWPLLLAAASFWLAAVERWPLLLVLLILLPPALWWSRRQHSVERADD